MRSTPAELHVAAVIMAALAVAEAIWTARCKPRPGQSKYGPWASACYGLLMAVLALAVGRVLQPVRVIAVAGAVPLAAAAVLGLLARREYRAWEKAAGGPRYRRRAHGR